MDFNFFEVTFILMPDCWQDVVNVMQIQICRRQILDQTYSSQKNKKEPTLHLDTWMSYSWLDGASFKQIQI